MKKNNTAVLIFILILVIVIFGAGVGVGIFYEAKNPKVQQAEKIQPTVNVLSSRVLQAANVFGKVENINGNNITLSYAGDKATVTVKSGADVFRLVPQKDKNGNLTTGQPQRAAFSDLKVGDNVTIALSVSSNGQLTGNQIYIFTIK